MKLRLSTRLLLSYAVIIMVGAAATYLTVRLLAPRLFDDRLRAGRGGRTGSSGPDLRSAFRSALNAALIVAVAVSAVAAGLIAAITSRVLLRPIENVRRATARIAAGDYQAKAGDSSVPELADLGADVDRLAAALADTESRRTRLLGDVAHEMRTPLTVLDGYIEGLVDGVFTTDAETLGALGEEVRRLRRLADDLSALSRAEEHRLDLHPVDTDLAVVASQAARRLSAQFDDATLTLTLDAPVAVPVHADPQRIEQVLTNLLGNAIAATPPSGSISLTVRRNNDRAEAIVADTGVGLAAGDLERIFERFYQVAGHHRRGPGTGVGLTIARGIARAHGGDVLANSPGPGHGSVFTLSLPLAG